MPSREKILSSSVAIVTLIVMLNLASAQNDTIEMDCDPSLSNRYDDCPIGYCCMRDDFLPLLIYCKRFGLENEACETQDSESSCPCAPGLYCKPNIGGPFPSLYGKCTVDDTPDRIDVDCDPSFSHRYDDCPSGYCCMRDEFLLTEIYCKKFGLLDEDCETQESESSCPCRSGLYCRANILGEFPSVYGKCAIINGTAATST